MDLAQASMSAQQAAFIQILTRSPVIAAILDRMPGLALPDCWLAGGCLSQTVWNAMSGHDPQFGISDYDLNYFDGSDLGWAAEDAVISRCTAVFAELGDRVEVRNQARVHLWYEQKFGTPCPPYRSCRQAISTYPTCGTSIGVRRVAGGIEVFAPYGLADVFAMRVRPNPVLAPAWVYQGKTARWLEHWPELDVLAWPR